jgi:hypothetical protein
MPSSGSDKNLPLLMVRLSAHDQNNPANSSKLPFHAGNLILMNNKLSYQVARRYLCSLSNRSPLA